MADWRWEREFRARQLGREGVGLAQAVSSKCSGEIFYQSHSWELGYKIEWSTKDAGNEALNILNVFLRPMCLQWRSRELIG